MSHSVAYPHIRHEILRDHLQQLSLKEERSKLAAGLTYHTAISLCENDVIDEEQHRAERASDVLPGGLTKEDVMRHEFAPLRMDARTQTQLRDSLRKTLRSLFDFWAAGEDVPPEEREIRTLGLYLELQNHQTQMEDLRAQIRALRGNIIDQVKEINEIHPRLEGLLMNALDRFPPSIHTDRTLRSEVLANTIETCLLKLSLMRYRLYTSLYGFASSSASSLDESPATMSSALNQTYHSLREKESSQQEEESRLDIQLRAYEEVMALVAGGRRERGGYAQVLEDMARVRQETEECRLDLRRLGWTGD